MAVKDPKVEVEDPERQSLLSDRDRETLSRENLTNGSRRRRNFVRRCTTCFYIGQWPVLYVVGMSAIANFFTHFPTQVSDYLGNQENQEESNCSGGNDHHTLSTAVPLSMALNGAILLLYPFFGWLSEAYVTYYRSIGSGLYLILIGIVIGFILSIALVFKSSLFYYEWIWVAIGISLVTNFLGNGIFKASAIQFGTDQMLEASSDQLSSFVHWYYWTTHIGTPAVYFVIILILTVTETMHVSLQYLTAILTISQAILAVIGITIFHAAKGHLSVQPTRRNTIKTIYDVLRYALKHKYPERRSAMTYWEDFNPSRIDLGKDRYGGPFTTEEVEDTKSFLRILVLLLSLFGLYTIEDTETLASQVHVMNLTHWHKIDYQPFNLLLTDTEFTTSFVVMLMIPLYQLAIKPVLNNYVPSMLKRFWLGLVCALMSSVGALAIKMLILDKHTCSITSIFSDNVETFLLLILIPQVLRGLAHLLVFLTGLEFILAQAPRKVQGLLIGLWYMMGVIDVANNSIDYKAKLKSNENVYIVRCCLTFVSLLLYSLMWYLYKYRDRDNLVDRYGLAVAKVARRIVRREQSVRTTSEFGVISCSDNSSINSSKRSNQSGNTTYESHDFSGLYED